MILISPPSGVNSFKLKVAVKATPPTFAVNRLFLTICGCVEQAERQQREAYFSELLSSGLLTSLKPCFAKFAGSSARSGTQVGKLFPTEEAVELLLCPASRDLFFE